MNTLKDAKIFLATTAREEFWDLSKPIVFLGDWCLRYSRRLSWKHLQTAVINSPLSASDKVEEAYSYVSGIYEHLLPQIGVVLNTIHKQKYSQRYWRIVIGNWFFDYISVIYDRYLLIRATMEQYPEFTTILLSENYFRVARDTQDFIAQVLDDPYNLQLFTRIIERLYPNEFHRKKLKIDLSKTYRYFMGQIKKLAKIILKINFMQIDKNNAKLFLRYSYFSLGIEKELVSRIGEAAIIKGGIFEPRNFPIDRLARAEFSKLPGSSDDFVALLLDLLPLDIPQCYVEGYGKIRKRILTFPKPRAIFSAVGWYFDEPFKQWAGLSAENGSLLIGSQHGGNYGSDAFMYAEEHELKITDRYYSWGWQRQGSFAEVTPFFSTKLCERNRIGADNSRKGILLVTTMIPRYVFIIQIFLNYNVKNYFNWESRFISSVSKGLREKLRVRLYQNDYGWDCLWKWQTEFPDINIENCGENFSKSMHNCRIYVCDHQGTTMLEAFAANKPTILFWSQENNKIRPEARYYYDNLRSVGILHDTPESAAAKLNSVYDDVEGWWNEPKLQGLVYEFSQRFCRTSTDALNNWEKELRRIVTDG